MAYASNIEEVREAARRLSGVAHRTPVITCETLDRISGRRIFFKCENLQKTGSFKFRGAWNSVSKLSREEAAKGVVTHSSGNHAQALSLAARKRGIDAHIVMPSSSSPVKRRAVEGYGGKVIECEPNLASRETTGERVLSETGGRFIPPYNYPDTISGQGTAALELIDEVPDLDAIIAPVGGGGLLSGTCIAAKGMIPRIRIFAGEPSGADDAARSMAAGKLIPQTAPNTIADGLLTSLGDLTWPIVRDHVERIVTVDDTETVKAMRLMWERAKSVIEPSAAVALAAVLSEEFRSLDRIDSIGVILSGGNVNLDSLPW